MTTKLKKGKSTLFKSNFIASTGKLPISTVIIAISSITAKQERNDQWLEMLITIYYQEGCYMVQVKSSAFAFTKVVKEKTINTKNH